MSKIPFCCYNSCHLQEIKVQEQFLVLLYVDFTFNQPALSELNVPLLFWVAWLSGLTAASHKDFSPHASKTLSFSITIYGYGLLGETLVKPYSSVSYKIFEASIKVYWNM